MKTLEQLTKKQLIELIIKIRPKSDAYDRVCQELGIENNILGEIKKIKKALPPSESICGSVSVGPWCWGCNDTKECKMYNKSKK